MFNKINVITVFAGLFLGFTSPAFAVDNAGRDVEGVWRLTAFDLDDGQGHVEPWCEGAHGVIIYTKGYMSVAINCESEPERMVHYSGPYHFNGQSVTHEVQNFSDPSLRQVFVRQVDLPNTYELHLIGPFGDGGKAVVSWERMLGGK